MKKEKYIIAPTCNLMNFGDLNFKESAFPEEIEKLKNGEAFILKNKGDWFLINPTIKHFLECFEQPTELVTLIKDLALKAQCQESEIEKPVSDFFKQMVSKKILTPASAFQKESPIIERINPGTIISNYIFEKRIFANQKVEIYKAKSIITDKNVAIKILKKQDKTHRSSKSFSKEFHLLKELGQHQHVCQFIELVETEERTFGVLEFVNGLPGRKFIKRVQPTLAAKINLLTQFFNGMAFIHQSQILHGDLHLSNLIMDENFHLKIIDFNMANRAKPQENEIMLEGGVHQYIAPEKLDKRAFRIVNGPASFASEVYQMGVIAYFFLYEKMPFEGFTWKSLANKIMFEKATFPVNSSNGEFISSGIRSIVRKMLHKHADRRFPRADEVFSKWKKVTEKNRSDVKLVSKFNKTA